jgi:hypothetical protein
MKPYSLKSVEMASTSQELNNTEIAGLTPMKDKLSSKSVIWAGFISFEVSSVINTMLYMFFYLSRIIHNDIVLSWGKPLNLIHVFFATALLSLSGTIISLLLNHIAGLTNKMFRIIICICWLFSILLIFTFSGNIPLEYNGVLSTLSLVVFVSQAFFQTRNY